MARLNGLLGLGLGYVRYVKGGGPGADCYIADGVGNDDDEWCDDQPWNDGAASCNVEFMSLLAPAFDNISGKVATQNQASAATLAIATIGGIGTIDFSKDFVYQVSANEFANLTNMQVIMFDVSPPNEQIIVVITSGGTILLQASGEASQSVAIPAIPADQRFTFSNDATANTFTAQTTIGGTLYSVTINVPASIQAVGTLGASARANMPAVKSADIVYTLYSGADEISGPNLPSNKIDLCDNPV